LKIVYVLIKLYQQETRKNIIKIIKKKYNNIMKIIRKKYNNIIKIIRKKYYKKLDVNTANRKYNKTILLDI